MAFPTTPVIDTFDRANEGPPMTGWANTGISANGIKLLSDQAQNASGSVCADYDTGSLCNANCESYVRIVAASASVGDSLGVLLRLTNPALSSITGYMVLAYKGSNVVRVFRIDNSGSFTQLGADITQTITNGDSLGANIVGSTITIYYRVGAGGWSLLDTRTDATYTTGGYLGLWINTPGGGAGAGIVDDFGGGSISSVSFPTTGILDNFNRANEGPPMTGWTGLNASITGRLVVSSNACASNASPATDCYNQNFGPDVEVYADYLGGQRAQVAGRVTNEGTTTPNYYTVFTNPSGSSGKLQLYRVDAGVATQLGSDINQGVSAGDSFGLSIIGSTIQVYYKPSGGSWFPVGPAFTDTTYSTAGKLGVITIDGTSVVIDNFGGGTYSPVVPRRGVFGGLLLALSSLLVPGSWVNAATRFKIYGTTWASAATRFIVQVIGFKDAATRFKLFGITFRDANTRFILWVRNYVDAATRFILQVRGYKDASTRFKMYGITWANAATRFVLNVRSYKDAATRFKLWVQGYRDVSTRFILQVRNYADASTRFVLTSANTTWKNANTRFILWVRGFRDANTRFKVVVQAYRDAATRFKLTVQSFKDAATRFKLIVQAYRDASTRFILTVRAYKDAATRFVLTSRSYKDANTRLKLYGITYRDAAARFVLIVQGTSFKDAATRFKLSGITWKNASTRFKVTVLTFRDAGSRFIVIARAFRDASSRFKVTVQAYRDASSRFKVTVRAYRDAGTRFITIARNFADGKTRFKVSVRSFRDGSTRFKVATLLQYRNSFTRFISVGGNSRNVNCRFALITVPPGYRKAVVDPEYRITTVPPQLRFPIVDKEGRPS